MTAEDLVTYELCPRRDKWSKQYDALRISLVKALYLALDAGLRTDKDPEKAAENAFVALAARPGLDFTGHDVYAVAMHYAKLAGILAAALRSTTSKPWTRYPSPDGWESACYDMGDGKSRRIALVDRWSDDRKQQEITGWRTIGEVCKLDQTIYVTAHRNRSLARQAPHIGMDSLLPPSTQPDDSLHAKGRGGGLWSQLGENVARRCRHFDGELA